MFYQVKIYDAKGELKKTISPKSLSNRFWKEKDKGIVDYSDGDADPQDWEGGALKNEKIKVDESL